MVRFRSSLSAAARAPYPLAFHPLALCPLVLCLATLGCTSAPPAADDAPQTNAVQNEAIAVDVIETSVRIRRLEERIAALEHQVGELQIHRDDAAEMERRLRALEAPPAPVAPAPVPTASPAPVRRPATPS